MADVTQEEYEKRLLGIMLKIRLAESIVHEAAWELKQARQELQELFMDTSWGKRKPKKGV